MENTNKDLTPTETDNTALPTEVSEQEEENTTVPKEADTLEPEDSDTPASEGEDEDDAEPERKILFMKAAQGYGMIFGFGVGYILSGILSELGFAAGKFECVLLCMFAGMGIGYLISNKKPKK